MFELKPLHHEAIPAALEKANRYRLLNEPGAAESIYLDILEIEPENQEALKNIVLAMSDRFGKDYAVGDTRVTEYPWWARPASSGRAMPSSSSTRRTLTT